MNEILRLLKIARRRLEWSRFLGRLHAVAIVVAAAALAVMIVNRLGSESPLPWMWIAPALVGAALLAAWLFWLRRRYSDLQVALAVDDRLALREQLSTAMHVQGRDDPFAQAAIEDAVRIAQDPRAHERVKRHFDVQAPRAWWISPLLVLMVVMASFLPPIDFQEHEVAADQASAQTQQVQQSVEAIVKEIEQSDELKKELAGLLEDMETGALDPLAQRDPQELKREALKKVTDLNQRLNELMNGEKGKAEKALKRAMSQLKTPESGPAKEFAEALSEGDFGQAKDALQKLAEQLQKGELSEEQKQQLAEQMEQLAQQLEQLAQQQQALEKALEQAGLDKQLAQNPQALQQALQNNQNLNEEQKQQLQQMAQAQQAVQQMCQGLGGACQQMAAAMQGQQGGQQSGEQGSSQSSGGQQTPGGSMGAGMGQAMDQLSQMEQLQQLMQQAQAAASACQGQGQGLGQGMGQMSQAMQQWQQQQGQGGMGNRGQGQGGKAPRARTPFKSSLEKANIKTSEGDIIASMLVEGPQRRGQSTKALTAAVLEQVEGYAEAIGEDELPRRYDDAHKHYFGELERQVKAIEQEAGAPAAPAEVAPPPAETAEAESGE